MSKDYRYRFRIDAFTPETLPMLRLAEYMVDLARLLGQTEHVHFDAVKPGSAVLAPWIDHPAVPKVNAQVHAVTIGEGPPEAMKAYERIDRRLAADNATGTLSNAEGAQIIRFRGREAPQPLEFGGVRQPGSLDGTLLRIGGTSPDRLPRLTLFNGSNTWHCQTTWDLVGELKKHLNEAPIRVHGDGIWRRDAEGKWAPDPFTVRSFELLDDAPWADIVSRLRSTDAPAWADADDPINDLRRLREGDETAH